VVDLDTSCPVGPALDAARAALAALPCPSVALARSADSIAAKGLLDRFDVVLERPEELGPLALAVRRSPLACLALVQLLRHGEGLSIHEGLIAESLVYSTLQSGPEFGAWLASRTEKRRGPPPAEPAVLVERCGSRLEITLNRPEKHNAFSAEMRDALCEALQIAVADPSLTDIALRGERPTFCSGGDLDEFGSLPDPATAHAIRSTRNPARLLAACAERVHAELHGACLGAGIELPAFAKRIAVWPDTSFRLPEVAMGLVPGAGGTVSLPRRIGRQRTAWLALSGLPIDAETALRWGLIDEIRD
jgi:enoyl-CoA hydratase/carnithine racemase